MKYCFNLRENNNLSQETIILFVDKIVFLSKEYHSPIISREFYFLGREFCSLDKKSPILFFCKAEMKVSII